jgi:hypothetical protein
VTPPGCSRGVQALARVIPTSTTSPKLPHHQFHLALVIHLYPLSPPQSILPPHSLATLLYHIRPRHCPFPEFSQSPLWPSAWPTHIHFSSDHRKPNHHGRCCNSRFPGPHRQSTVSKRSRRVQSRRIRQFFSWRWRRWPSRSRRKRWQRQKSKRWPCRFRECNHFQAPSYDRGTSEAFRRRTRRRDLLHLRIRDSSLCGLALQPPNLSYLRVEDAGTIQV